MPRRRISQREGARLRKEVAALRSFLYDLRYMTRTRAKMEIGRVSLCDLSRGRVEGIRASWRDALLVAQVEGNEIVCYAHVPPQDA